MIVMVASRPYHYAHTIGLLALNGRGFSNPMDVAVGKERMLYVINRSNATQAPQGAVRVTICRVDGEYVGEFGGYGTGDAGFVWPTSVATDSRGNIYVSDEHRHDIQVFDSDGNFLRKWGEFGEGDGQLNRPSGLAIDGEDNVVVVDNINNRVQKFTPQGKPILKFGRAGSGEGEFNLPWGVGVDSQGHIYVADWRNDRVQKFDSHGHYLSTFGTSGSGIGQLKRPASVSVDQHGNVYVADWGNERVHVFTPEGHPLTTLIGDADLSKWGAEYLQGNADLVKGRQIAADMEPEKRFWGPTAVEVDSEGHVIVVDSCRHRLQIYQRDR